MGGCTPSKVLGHSRCRSDCPDECCTRSASSFSTVSDLTVWNTHTADFTGLGYTAEPLLGPLVRPLSHRIPILTDPIIEPMESMLNADLELDEGEYLDKITKTCATQTFIRASTCKTLNLEPAPPVVMHVTVTPAKKRRVPKGKSGKGKTRRGRGLKKFKQNTRKRLTDCKPRACQKPEK